MFIKAEEEIKEKKEEIEIDKMDLTNIITLTDGNYTEEIIKLNSVFLYIYSPYCKYCKLYMPEFISAANYAKEKKLEVSFVKVDGIANKNFLGSIVVDRYPTIFLFIKTKDKDKKYIYTGLRKKEAFIEYFEEKFSSYIKVVDSLEEIDNIVNKKKIVLISTIKDKTSPIYKSFDFYSIQTERLGFISCLSDTCLKKYGEDITLLKPFDEKINQYSKDFGDFKNVTLKSVRDFVGMFSIEAGTSLGNEETNMFWEFTKDVLFYFRDSENEEQTKYDNLFKELGIELRKENIYTFVLDIKGNFKQSETSQFFAVSKDDLPSIIFYIKESDPERKSYRKINLSKEQLNKKYILKFLKEVKDGKNMRDLASGPKPSKALQDSKGAKIVIGRTYDKDVIEESNNVCIAFVTNQMKCELCDKYSEVFKILGNKYKNNTESNVIYAIMDGIENEARDLVIIPQELPLIYLYINSLPEKKIIKFIPQNKNEISVAEVEIFVSMNLKENIRKKRDGKNEKQSDATKTDL